MMKTILVPILTDTTNEAAETVRLTLSNPTGKATLGSTNPATLTINDAPDPNAVPLAGAPFFNATITGTNLTFTRTLNITSWGLAASGSSVTLYTNWATGNIPWIYAQKDTDTSTRSLSDTISFSEFQIVATGSRPKGTPALGTIYYDFYDEDNNGNITSYTAEWESGLVRIDGISFDGGGNLTGISGRMDIIVRNLGSTERFRIVGSFRTKP